MQRRGDVDGFGSQLERFRQNSRAAINNALSPITVCIHNPSRFAADQTVLCNAPISELEDAYGNPGPAQVLTVNTGSIQSPTYGFGMVTSIASAVLGLEASDPNGARFSFTTDQQKVLRGFAREMQSKVDASGNFSLTGCVQVTPPAYAGGPYTLASGFRCDANKYHPRLFRLYEFYRDYTSLGMPSGAYQSNSVDLGLYRLNATDYVWEDFTFGRYEAFVQHGYQWFVDRTSDPNRYLPRDPENPIGYLDSISSAGVAKGWTCDKDMPGGPVGGRIKVSFYANDDWNLQAEGWANEASEPAVNSACGGGSAHRFTVTLPPSTKGAPIRAYGLDYTWYGFTQLICLQNPCSW